MFCFIALSGVFTITTIYRLSPSVLAVSFWPNTATMASVCFIAASTPHSCCYLTGRCGVVQHGESILTSQHCSRSQCPATRLMPPLCWHCASAADITTDRSAAGSAGWSGRMWVWCDNTQQWWEKYSQIGRWDEMMERLLGWSDSRMSCRRFVHFI